MVQDPVIENDVQSTQYINNKNEFSIPQDLLKTFGLGEGSQQILSREYSNINQSALTTMLKLNQND